jgi:hypothetical protein
MREPARVRLPRMIVPAVEHPDALDETVVHDPSGRPWLVCTSDRLYPLDGVQPEGADPALPQELADRDGRYETQVYYTARAGIRGFPTGHGERYPARADAVAGHRRWCLMVRLGEVCPDLIPDAPL